MLAVSTTTFVVFCFRCSAWSMLATFPHLLPTPLFLGVLFICALPSTVQSSIALTSIAGGNVPGAVCAATVSNIAGIVIAPLLFGAMSHRHSSGIDLKRESPVSGPCNYCFRSSPVTCRGPGAAPGPRATGPCSRSPTGDRSCWSFSRHSAPQLCAGSGNTDASGTAGSALALLMIVLLGFILSATLVTSRLLGFDHADQAALIFCGTQKSLISGVPIANALFSGAVMGPLLLPMMLYYPIQLLLCAWIARRYHSLGSVENEEASELDDQPSLPARPIWLDRALSSRQQSVRQPAAHDPRGQFILLFSAADRPRSEITRPGSARMIRQASVFRLAVLSLGLLCSIAARPACADDTILKLSESATVMAAPDELAASMRAEAVAPTAQDAQKRVNEMMGSAVAAAKKVSGIVVSTGSYSVWRTAASPTDRAERWQSGQSLNVTGKDAEAMLKLVGDLQQMGLVQSNLLWRLSRDSERKARQDATKQALSTLRARADEAAEILGLRFASFREVRLDSVAPPPILPRMQMATRNDVVTSPPPNAEAEDMPVTASAEADVVLKPR